VGVSHRVPEATHRGRTAGYPQKAGNVPEHDWLEGDAVGFQGPWGTSYAFVRSLGPAGAAAPAYVAPGGKVTTPYIVFVPVTDQKQAAAR